MALVAHQTSTVSCLSLSGAVKQFNMNLAGSFDGHAAIVCTKWSVTRQDEVSDLCLKQDAVLCGDYIQYRHGHESSLHPCSDPFVTLM